MLLKKLLFLCAFISVSLTHASQQPSTKDIMDRLNRMSSDLYKIKTDSTADALHSCASAINTVSCEGIKMEHSIKVPYSAILGFATCLSLYSLWRGAINYINAHKTSKSTKDEQDQEKVENKKAASWQIGLSLCTLAASCIGLLRS